MGNVFGYGSASPPVDVVVRRTYGYIKDVADPRDRIRTFDTSILRTLFSVSDEVNVLRDVVNRGGIRSPIVSSSYPVRLSGNVRNKMSVAAAEPVSGVGSVVTDEKVDLRPFCPGVYDQGQIGSCTANAIAAAYEYDLRKQALADFVPSRLFIYYNERVMENTVGTDSGAQIRDGIKVLNTQGVCHETSWPYDASRCFEKPTDACYSDAKSCKAVAYHRVAQDIDQLRTALKLGFPVVFGFQVYASFESVDVSRTGNMPMPKADEKVLGGHAVMAVGFDDEKKVAIVRNSWGEAWGDEGYFYMPYAFWSDPNQCSDFWTVTSVTE